MNAPLAVLIRFKNSAATLPGVLAGLRAQTLQPDFILGVDSGSTDGSRALLTEAGARLVSWSEPYHHARVLNFGLEHCPANRVLILSSHTVLESPDALERLHRALDDPRVACASSPWDDDPYYSAAITQAELQAKGLKLGSIYSNSFGLLRRSLWEDMPFDESLATMEDYDWALAQCRRGMICRRVRFQFSYQRQANTRDLIFTAYTFRLAARYGLRVCWLGRKASLQKLLGLAWRKFREKDNPGTRTERALHFDRLLGSLIWPYYDATTDNQAPPSSNSVHKAAFFRA